MEQLFFQGFMYALPALVTGMVAFYFFSAFKKDTNNATEVDMLVEKKKHGLPIKLQAYERMLLFCERINPIKLLVRVKPIGDRSHEYLQLLIQTIEQEFEHNLVQQLYISETSWKAVLASKTAVIHKLSVLANEQPDASLYREHVLRYYQQELPPTHTATSILKSEVAKLL